MLQQARATRELRKLRALPQTLTSGDTRVITLHGFPISNYYNKVKLALLEKNVPFTEEFVHPKNADAAVFAMSPLGKIPFIRTPQGALCESQAIMEYIALRRLTPAQRWCRPSPLPLARCAS